MSHYLRTKRARIEAIVQGVVDEPCRGIRSLQWCVVKLLAAFVLTLIYMSDSYHHITD